MTDKQLLTQAKQFLGGKDFFIDYMYNNRLQADEKVICYTLDDYPDYIKVKNFQELIRPSNQAL